jgi:hypothetical protein
MRLPDPYAGRLGQQQKPVSPLTHLSPHPTHPTPPHPPHPTHPTPPHPPHPTHPTPPQREADGASLFMPREAADVGALNDIGGEINNALTNPFFGAL